MPLDWNRGALAEGLRCYEAEQFFLAHEHWESVWLESPEPEKSFLQALIQIAAAFHHLQRKNAAGAASLLRAALRKLEPFPPYFGDITVPPIRHSLCAWLQALYPEASLPNLPFPLIRETPEGRNDPTPIIRIKP